MNVNMRVQASASMASARAEVISQWAQPGLTVF